MKSSKLKVLRFFSYFFLISTFITLAACFYNVYVMHLPLSSPLVKAAILLTAIFLCGDLAICTELISAIKKELNDRKIPNVPFHEVVISSGRKTKEVPHIVFLCEDGNLYGVAGLVPAFFPDNPYYDIGYNPYLSMQILLGKKTFLVVSRDTPLEKNISCPDNKSDFLVFATNCAKRIPDSRARFMFLVEYDQVKNIYLLHEAIYKKQKIRLTKTVRIHLQKTRSFWFIGKPNGYNQLDYLYNTKLKVANPDDYENKDFETSQDKEIMIAAVTPTCAAWATLDLENTPREA